jgi:hypothetical protein
MRKVFLPKANPAIPIIAGLFFLLISITPGAAQQYVIVDKDNTRPNQATYNQQRPVTFSSFEVSRLNGYNEIKWETTQEASIVKFIVEYSLNGTDYLSAGEVNSASGHYLLKHQTMDKRPMLYRLKTEYRGGRFYYSNSFLLDGVDISPVEVYPTVVTGNVINANASWPVERINIVSSGGSQVYAKDINGQSNFIPVAIPQLSKGMYWITFYGSDWKTTSKFLVP